MASLLNSGGGDLIPLPPGMQPCDPLGRMKINGREIGRDGRFCSGDLGGTSSTPAEFPLNTVCINALPPDFCASVRPKTVHLPPRWRPAFIKVDEDGGPGTHSEDDFKLGDQRFIGNDPSSGRRQVVADEGDPVCSFDEAERDGMPDGSRHWGQPWCITPAALQRYARSHPGWLDVKCGATLPSLTRLGPLGALCSRRHSARQARKLLAESDGSAALMRDRRRIASQEAVSLPPGPPEGSRKGELPAVSGGSVDPYVDSGGLGRDSSALSHTRPAAAPGMDWGIYGGRNVFSSSLE